MAQHKMKKKVSLPAGAKTKSGKVKKPQANKRGLMAAPKKPQAVADMKKAQPKLSLCYQSAKKNAKRRLKDNDRKLVYNKFKK
uniref:RPL25 n=1 Tax=Strongyloides papillosus TaxID=174720 RepID=A0A0N5BG52_STREA